MNLYMEIPDMNTTLQAAQIATPALSANQTIGQIAVELPGATAVFRRLKLDFCCGGQIPLAQAVAQKGLDLDAVMVELSALQSSDILPGVTEPGELIEHLLTRYHSVHRAQLPELLRMARRVEAVHRDSPDVPAGLADVLEKVEQDLLLHMQKEEEILFPLLKSGGAPLVANPIGMMRSEHVQHSAALDKINALTNDATPPQGACNTWRALYAGIAQFSEDLTQHIHLENNVLFSQFEAAAQPAAASNCGASACACSA